MYLKITIISNIKYNQKIQIYINDKLIKLHFDHKYNTNCLQYDNTINPPNIKIIPNHLEFKYDLFDKKLSILTAANKKFQYALLTLISSINKNCYHDIDNIYIYDLGIDTDIINTLNKLDKINIIKFPDLFHDANYNILDLQYYGFKPYILFHSKNIIDNNIVLYLDAGILINKSLLTITKIINQHDVFITNHNDRKNGDKLFVANVCHPEVIKYLNLKDQELLAPVVKAGIFGYKINGKYQNLIHDLYNLCMKKEVMKYDKFDRIPFNPNFLSNITNNDIIERYFTGHRHDQTILSILIKKYSCNISSGKKYAYSIDNGVSKSNYECNKIGKSGKLINIQNEQVKKAFFHIHRGLKIDIDALYYYTK